MKSSYKIIGQGSKEPYEIHPGIFRFELTTLGGSWIDVYHLPKSLIPSEKEFETLWNLHPPEKGRIKIMGKEVQTPRWQQTYLKEYWFSGMIHRALPLPKEFQPFLDFANSEKHDLYPGKTAIFNEVLLNWYESSMYIGPHSDDEKELVVGPKGETLVWSLTLQPKGKPRIFRLKPKTGGKDRLDIELTHGIVVIMGGTCQRTHKHQVPKVGRAKASEYGKRINVTLRMFK